MLLKQGVRVIAVFEAAKGLTILLAGFGLLSLMHRNMQQLAETLVSHFHLNPASRYPRIFIELASHLNDGKLWLMALLAFAYAGMRIAEGYGLWYGRKWAEWLAVISSGIYVPLEIYELAQGASPIKAGTLAANIAILIYMIYVLKKQDEWDRADEK